MASALRILSDAKCHGGRLQRFAHDSSATGTEMKFHVFTPPAPERNEGASGAANAVDTAAEGTAANTMPLLWFLSGLTCTDENFVQKGCAMRAAAQHGIALIAPDTSPRGAGIAGEDDDWDFGSGAGFYVDATVDKWSKNYRMYSYITEELPLLLRSAAAQFPRFDFDRQSITGHSMGGHGALICALKNPARYRSCSAFAPIAHPIDSPWGQKAFSGYFGSNNTEEWRQWDATELVKSYDGPTLHLLIDQGTDDGFYKNEPRQLKPENFVTACVSAGVQVELNLREGYDHSYFFIQSFIDEHIAHHARALA